ncbi:hypothetical protein LTR37_000020 [Vermiconidia calcicola]|uniref:Uncharacterized protein n=1 Tax=Vermiconidia calcicola TaxID=1690605 RepID=A0ACC3P0Q9_9PEZI|nr:hypothetical protein LTR37_000020 [Vermiconidia calcicola]
MAYCVDRPQSQGDHMAWLNLTNTDQPYTQYQSGRPQQGAFNSYNVATSTANAAIPPYSSYHLPMMSHPKETMLTYVGQGQPNGYRHHNGGSFTPFVNRHEALPYDNMDQMSNWSQRYWYMPGLSGEHMAGGEGTIRPRHSPPKQLLSVPRGPPRKPGRSGHAIWVGNLPQNLPILRLIDHFTRGDSQHVQSIFLMSRSNCAFVNYRTEEACKSAQVRFHGTQIDDRLIVCRTRNDGEDKSNSLASPQIPNTLSNGAANSVPDDLMPLIVGMSSTSIATNAVVVPKAPEKFIVLKSLTLEDLEASVRQQTWTTQLHNEDKLNKAFSECETLYLIFSANKSGQYFGYARMVRPISYDYAEVSSNDVVELEDYRRNHSIYSPKPSISPGTSLVPEGRIVDDSERGILFWEAVPTDKEGNEKPQGKDAAGRTNGSGGRAFSIEWLSTTRLPFYITRGLRNPWNQNREIKIARDGTAIEPSVGRRLIDLFATV